MWKWSVPSHGSHFTQKTQALLAASRASHDLPSSCPCLRLLHSCLLSSSHTSLQVPQTHPRWCLPQGLCICCSSVGPSSPFPCFILPLGLCPQSNICCIFLLYLFHLLSPPLDCKLYASRDFCLLCSLLWSQHLREHVSNGIVVAQ